MSSDRNAPPPPAPIARPSAATIVRAVEILSKGGLVAIPTETVYGLGADATNARAVARLYEIKGRPSFNPLIAHVPDIGAALRQGVFDDNARRLAKAFWPGPLTLVVPKAPTITIAEIATAGLDTVALRVPAQDLAQAILAAFGKPVVAPSANRSGYVSPTTADHVAQDFAGGIDLIVDGGPTRHGLESTVVACLGDTPRLLRPGAIPAERLRAVLGAPIEHGSEGPDAAPRSPGMLAAHYQPHADIRLDVHSVEPDEALIDFGDQRIAGKSEAHLVRDLSPSGDLLEAAANLFAVLREMDDHGAARIAVAPIPKEGLGEAINDRLRRAAV